MVGGTDRLDIAVDWDVKPQTKQMKLKFQLSWNPRTKRSGSALATFKA